MPRGGGELKKRKGCEKGWKVVWERLSLYVPSSVFGGDIRSNTFNPPIMEGGGVQRQERGGKGGKRIIRRKKRGKRKEKKGEYNASYPTRT